MAAGASTGTAADAEATTDAALVSVLGTTRVEPLLRDSTLSEVMVNSFQDIYVERDGRLQRVDAAFGDEDAFRRLTDRASNAATSRGSDDRATARSSGTSTVRSARSSSRRTCTVWRAVSPAAVRCSPLTGIIALPFREPTVVRNE